MWSDQSLCKCVTMVRQQVQSVWTNFLVSSAVMVRVLEVCPSTNFSLLFYITSDPSTEFWQLLFPSTPVYVSHYISQTCHRTTFRCICTGVHFSGARGGICLLPLAKHSLPLRYMYMQWVWQGSFAPPLEILQQLFWPPPPLVHNF